jgi:hypothetical protein
MYAGCRVKGDSFSSTYMSPVLVSVLLIEYVELIGTTFAIRVVIHSALSYNLVGESKELSLKLSFVTFIWEQLSWFLHGLESTPDDE